MKCFSDADAYSLLKMLAVNNRKEQIHEKGGISRKGPPVGQGI